MKMYLVLLLSNNLGEGKIPKGALPVIWAEFASIDRFRGIHFEPLEAVETI
jgi:hypothetical protein